MELTKKNLNNSIATIMTKFENSMISKEKEKLQKSFELKDVTSFINYLKNIKQKISSTAQIQETLKSNPEYNPIALLFPQIESFIDNFVKAIEDLVDMNQKYIIGWISEKEKRVSDCMKNKDKRYGIERLNKSSNQWRRTSDAVQRLATSFTNQGFRLSAKEQQLVDNHRGGSKHENIFIKNFKKTLHKFDKILENTKLSVTDKEKKLQKAMKNFKKDLDNQVVKFKKMTVKSTKKTTKIIKRSIHKLQKLSQNTKKIIKKPIKKKLTKKTSLKKKPLRKITTKKKTRKN
jgi:hypothetical protein